MPSGLCSARFPISLNTSSIRVLSPLLGVVLDSNAIVQHYQGIKEHHHVQDQ